ncbi:MULTISPECIES: YfiR family protein [unclassified Pseudoxanthomonas]|uniref:YfiR family protein n=1 Tax=unclassified Pseudoxanthomonas TaxID=2645906 RepID=UPI00307874F4
MRPPRLRPVRQPSGRTRVLLTLLALLVAGPPSAFAQVDESALKAAFVYNIVAFASWDSESGTGEGTGAIIDPNTLVICTDANKSLDTALAHLAGRAIGRRRITVHAAAAEGTCNVLVHAGRMNPNYTLPHALVICDGCDLPDGTTAVALVREGNRIRFDVDPASAAKAGVSFSSQLLRLARRVM